MQTVAQVLSTAQPRGLARGIARPRAARATRRRRRGARLRHSPEGRALEDKYRRSWTEIAGVRSRDGARIPLGGRCSPPPTVRRGGGGASGAPLAVLRVPPRARPGSLDSSCLAAVAAADLVLSRGKNSRPGYDRPLQAAGISLRQPSYSSDLRPSSIDQALGFIAAPRCGSRPRPVAVPRVPDVDDPARSRTACWRSRRCSPRPGSGPGPPGTRWPAPRPGRSPTSPAISPSARGSSCSSRSAGGASRCPIRCTSAPWRRSPPAPLSPRRRASRRAQPVALGARVAARHAALVAPDRSELARDS